MILLAKSKLNSIGFLISKALIDSNISHGEFILINNLLKKTMIGQKKSKISMTNKTLNYV